MVFWSKWWHSKGVLKLSDLKLYVIAVWAFFPWALRYRCDWSAGQPSQQNMVDLLFTFQESVSSRGTSKTMSAFSKTRYLFSSPFIGSEVAPSEETLLNAYGWPLGKYQTSTYFKLISYFFATLIRNAWVNPYAKT